MNIKEQQAIAAAIRLFGEMGIDNTPTQKIAKEAGIGNATLFKYFESKDELIRRCYLYAKLDVANTIKKDLAVTNHFEEMLRGVWKNFYEWCRENPLTYNFIQQIKNSRYVDAEIETLVDQEFLFFKVALQAAKTRGEIMDEPIELIQATLMAFMNLAIDAHDQLPDIGEEKIYQIMLNSMQITKAEHGELN